MAEQNFPTGGVVEKVLKLVLSLALGLAIVTLAARLLGVLP
jgi:hypothetical protein